MHMNFKEALAVVFSAERWASRLCNKKVYIYCDNTSAVAMLNKGTTRNDVMMRYLRRLFWLSATFNFRLKAFHVPGVDNVLADDISRLHQPEHLLSFMRSLDQVTRGCAAQVSALEHMSMNSYYLLIGLYTSNFSSI